MSVFPLLCAAFCSKIVNEKITSVIGEIELWCDSVLVGVVHVFLCICFAGVLSVLANYLASAMFSST